ncbi:MAG: flagellin [Chromatiales bacterium 21-64-14]|nr:MAG: flagellin [Chromatiales bacterium 21-64-14]HQU15096.1 flagellin [Gammaproteobacteria bacterium]
MALVINTNMNSLVAQNNLSKSQDALSQAIQRLSSGLRINSAKDDAAGFFTSQLMTQDINGMNQAVRNANDGVSLAQTAGGAMTQISSDLQRINQLAVQSANGTVQNRTGLQAEVDQLTQDISQIVQTTSFTGVNMLAGTSGTITFQVGAQGSASDQISVTGLNLTTLKSYAAGLTATGTVDVSTQAAASAAIANVQADIQTVAADSATFGAVENRFSAVINNLTNTAQNLTAARSRIVDANFAQETANLSRAQILQQAGVAVLQQANTSPNIALTLLR